MASKNSSVGSNHDIRWKSGQIPFSKARSLAPGELDALHNLPSTKVDEASNIEDTADICNNQYELYSSIISTSDDSGAMAGWSPLIDSGTDNNPLESTVHNSSGIEKDLSGNSIPVVDLTLFANTEVINSICPFEDADKPKSTLSQENDNLDTYDEPGDSELKRPLSEEFPPCSENETLESIPTLDLTPTVLNGVTTPNISKSSMSSEKLSETGTDTENLSESKSTEKILLDAGYAITEIKDMMTLKRKHEEGRQVTFEKNKPKTHVFSQGMVYTYDKLDIATNATVTKPKSRQSVTSLRKERSPKRSSVSVLDPSATSFIP